MKVPAWQRMRGLAGDAGRLEQRLYEWAEGITGNRGALTNGLNFADNFRGRFFQLKRKTPDVWVPVTLLNGFSRFNAPQFGVPAVRAWGSGMEAGARGAIMRSPQPTSSLPAFALPEGYAPTLDGDTRRQVDNLGTTLSVMEVVPSTPLLPGGFVQWVAGTTQFLDLASVRWELRKARPDWPKTSWISMSLGLDFPGDVAQVLVLDAVDVNGVHLGVLPCQWNVVRKASTHTLNITRVNDVSPLTEYTFSVAVLSG